MMTGRRSGDAMRHRKFSRHGEPLIALQRGLGNWNAETDRPAQPARESDQIRKWQFPHCGNFLLTPLAPY